MRFVLLDVCGDTGSLAPLSGMTLMTDLELNNNQLTGMSAVVDLTHDLSNESQSRLANSNFAVSLQ